MTFTDIIEHSSKLFHNFSMNKNLNKKDQHRKLKRLNPSIVNLSHRHQQTKNFERKNTNDEIQQRNSSLHLPLITKSDLSKSISNKSLTFASVFDELENQNNHHTTLDIDKPVENKDLVIVVPNKYINNEPPVNNTNTEPYPFRSEVPSCLLRKSNSSTNMVHSSYSKKKSFHHLIRSHRPKKLCHSVKTIDQSKSVPNLLFSSSTSNDHHRSLNSIRQWFKSSLFGRVVQSFIKHPNENTKHLKQKSRIKSPTSRKYSDVIY